MSISNPALEALRISVNGLRAIDPACDSIKEKIDAELKILKDAGYNMLSEMNKIYENGRNEWVKVQIDELSEFLQSAFQGSDLK